MIAQPVTFIVLVLLVLLIGGGCVLIRSAMRRGAAAASSVACPSCRHANPADARFCAHCGAAMR